MQLDSAVGLIEHELFQSDLANVWADLGCGSGLFTRALARILPDGSVVHALDKNFNPLKQIPDTFDGSKIKKHLSDFTKFDLPLNNLDGILMANSLHFVSNKNRLIDKIKNQLGSHGVFLIVEYERSFPSPWVPYPITYGKAKALFMENDFVSIRKLNELPSQYGGAIYSMLALKSN